MSARGILCVVILLVVCLPFAVEKQAVQVAPKDLLSNGEHADVYFDSQYFDWGTVKDSDLVSAE